MIKLNIGSNDVKINGWMNMDILDIPGVTKYDARSPIPYSDSSVDFIFSEHFIEHLNETEALYYFKECYRVLKPGGVVRTSTFDIEEIIINLHSRSWSEFRKTYCGGLFKDKTRMETFNLIVYEGNLHKYMYNNDELIRFLKIAGFTTFLHGLFKESSFTELQNLEWRENSTCIVEAVK